MSDKVHYKGRFINLKVLHKRLKAVAGMAEAKKRKKNCTKDIGTRIVEVDELAKNLTCCVCQKDILLKNIGKETRIGFNSVFSIKCQDCSTLTNVSTGRKHTSKEGVKCSDVNTKIALGAVYAAKNNCKRAAEEERCLVVENVKKLCDEL